MDPKLTMGEILAISRAGPDDWNPEDYADAATRKALWCAREFVRGYVETGAPIVGLMQSMDRFIVEPWETGAEE